VHIESSRGRVIDMAGDSVLAVFETATGAVSRRSLFKRNSESLVPTAACAFRIGMHLGDVIEKADGTVAARRCDASPVRFLHAFAKASAE